MNEETSESVGEPTSNSDRWSGFQWLRKAPVADLAPMGRVPDSLAQAGISSIGELMEKSDAELMAIRGIGTFGVTRLRRRLGLLARLSESEPFDGSDPMGSEPPVSDHPLKVPRVPSAVLEPLLNAKTVRQEVEALAEGLPPRNAALFLARLGAGDDPRPNLEDLGAAWGISRERVRQIVDSRSRTLAQSGVRLPLSERLAHVLDEEGGFASTPELLELARMHGVDADRSILHAIRYLHEIGLVPLVEYVPDVDSWVTEKGKETWVRSGILAEHLERVRSTGRTFLRRISCVEGCRLADGCLLTRWQRTRALTSWHGRLVEVDGYLIPEPTIPSKLTRSVQKMLAVSPMLSVRDVSEGLARLLRELQVVPPVSVVEHLLSHHPGFEMRDGWVRPADVLSARDPLSKAERTFVSLLEEEGGLVAYRVLLEGMEAEGFSKHTAAVLMAKSPFLRRADVGLYATLGRTFPRERFLALHSDGKHQNGKR